MLILHQENEFDFEYAEALAIDFEREAELLAQMKEAQANPYSLPM